MQKRFLILNGTLTLPDPQDEWDSDASVNFCIPLSDNTDRYYGFDEAAMAWYELSKPADLFSQLLDHVDDDYHPFLHRPAFLATLSNTVSWGLQNPKAWCAHFDDQSPLGLFLRSCAEQMDEEYDRRMNSEDDYIPDPPSLEEVENLFSNLVVAKKRLTKAERLWLETQVRDMALRHNAPHDTDLEFWLACTPEKDLVLMMEIPMLLTMSSGITALETALF